MFKWPGESFELAKVKSKVSKAYLLDGKKPVKMTQSGDTVKLTLPAAAPGPIATVVVLETK
jgi:hypothetical protein